MMIMMQWNGAPDNVLLRAVIIAAGGEHANHTHLVTLPLVRLSVSALNESGKA